MSSTGIVAALGAGVAAGLALLLDDRRQVLGALLGLYAFCAWMLSGAAGLPLALASLVVGAAVCAILLRARPGGRGAESLPTGRGFRAAAMLMVLIPASGLVNVGILAALPMPYEVRLASMWVMALGALLVGLASDVDKRTIGHLILLCGFGLFYFPIEPSLLLVVLLAAVHFGLALVGTYLGSAPSGSGVR